MEEWKMMIASRRKHPSSFGGIRQLNRLIFIQFLHHAGIKRISEWGNLFVIPDVAAQKKQRPS